MSRIVIALGGNALGNTPYEQLELVTETAKPIVDLIEAGNEVIIAHGNGPQVGMINLAMSAAAEAGAVKSDMPFPECGAMSQGYIGYHLQNAIGNELVKRGINKPVATIVTQVLVDENDGAFQKPTKPIGAFYTKEKDVVEAVVNSGAVVITVGGGGIPVIKKDGKLVGVPAVIDKDFASSKIAELLHADALFILTAVDRVAINWGKPDQKSLEEMSIAEAEKYIGENQFAPGSMLPKVQAAIAFAQSGGRAIIADLHNAALALEGKSGTAIHK